MVIKEKFMDGMFTDIELIDKYQRGTANKEEKHDVQNRLVEDSSFRKLFDDMEVMSEGIRKSGAKSTLEEKLAKLDTAVEDKDESNSEETEEDIGSAPTKVFVWYNSPVTRAIAASVVLIVVGWVAFGPMNKVNNQELVVQYFEPYANVKSPTRGEIIDIDDTAVEAFIVYDRGDYEASIPLFIEVIKNGIEPLMNTFYLGNAYLEAGDSENAIISFSMVVKAEKGLAGIAEWYLALSYLNNDNVDKSIASLKHVKDYGEEFYAEKAGDLLSKLK